MGADDRKTGDEQDRAVEMNAGRRIGGPDMNIDRFGYRERNKSRTDQSCYLF